MGCAATTAKYILFAVNLFFALAGLTLLFLGVAIQIKITHVAEAMEGKFQMAPISAMVIGGIVFLIAFLGCCGATMENNCMLITYAVVMLILAIVKVTMSIVLFVKTDLILDQIPVVLTKTFEQNEKSFYDVETTFKCCGTEGAHSYNKKQLISSCCPPGVGRCQPEHAYPGCNNIVKNYFKTYATIIAYVALGVGVLDLAAAIMALCLVNTIRNKNNSVVPVPPISNQ